MRNCHLLIAVIFMTLAFCCVSSESEPELTPLAVFADAFSNQRSDIQVRQHGTIVAVLSDDTVGDRHQRMIVRLGNDQTLLIAHNIDLAPRVPDPLSGKTLGFYGEYEWNDEGGVIHWTHADPDGKHVNGWLEYEGKRYGGGDPSYVGFIIDAWFTHEPFSATSTSRGIGEPGIAGKTVFDILGHASDQGSVRRPAGLYVVKSSNGSRGWIRTR